MSPKIKIGAIIFFAIILQISFFPSLTFGKIIPDVALVLIIIWSSKRKFEDIWLGVFASGIILDLALFGKVGINTISFISISFITSFLQERFFINQKASSFPIVVALVAGGTVFNFVAVNLLNDFRMDIFSSWLIAKIVGNIVISFFLYLMVVKFGETFGIKESKLLVK